MPAQADPEEEEEEGQEDKAQECRLLEEEEEEAATQILLKMTMEKRCKIYTTNHRHRHHRGAEEHGVQRVRKIHGLVEEEVAAGVVGVEDAGGAHSQVVINTLPAAMMRT